MKNFFFLIILMIAFSCQNDKKQNIVIEKSNEIEKIVDCVILQDSLNVFKNDSTAIPVSKELKKLKVYQLDQNTKKIPPKPINGIYLNDLFYYKLDMAFFPKKDSLKILEQNDILKTYFIKNHVSKKILMTTFEEQKRKSQSNDDANFLYLTIPIFSSDYKKAYVEVSEVCFGNCGWGKAIYLEKENGKWKIVYKRELWIG